MVECGKAGDGSVVCAGERYVPESDDASLPDLDNGPGKIDNATAKVAIIEIIAVSVVVLLLALGFYGVYTAFGLLPALIMFVPMIILVIITIVNPELGETLGEAAFAAGVVSLMLSDD